MLKKCFPFVGSNIRHTFTVSNKLIMTSKDILNKMQEIEKRDPLTIEQMLNINMLDHKEQVRKQAVKELLK